MKRLFTLLALMLAAVASAAGAREIHNINRGWKFFAYNEKDSLTVNLPHSWNSDALAGRKDYYRGIGNYLKYIDIKPEWRHKRIFVKFNGAGSITDLIVNGRFVGEHRGGSSAFTFEITDYVDFNRRNLFWVVVNNAARIDVLPTAGPENIYGGIYRSVELIVTEANTIGFDDYGSDGLMFRTNKITEKKAEGTVDVAINASLPRQVQLDLDITDATGVSVFRSTIKPRTEKGLNNVSIPFEVQSPILWHGIENPYLYNVTVTLTDGNNTDVVSAHTGIRSLALDSGGGLLLNGKPYPLNGVVLYRDRASYGPVSSVVRIAEDLDIIREMGANAIRVAGGAHDPVFYEMCDRLGIVVLTESPFVGSNTLSRKGFYNTADFRDNARRQLTELISQHYNNPSVAAWGIFAEPELRGDNPIPFIRDMNNLARTLDPSRPTYGSSSRDGEVNAITDLIIWNHTLGWLEGNPSDIAIWQEQLHGDPVWSKLRSAVSFRCGGSPEQQDAQLRRAREQSSWHPENWQTHFHETYFHTLRMDRRFWGMFVGNMFDFGSVQYSWGATPGVNDCGLASFDRRVRKDAFYLYKANWNDHDMFVHITGKRREVRSSKTEQIKVYSNCPEVELFVNGQSLGMRSEEAGIFTWDSVSLRNGTNILRAASTDGQEDTFQLTIDN